MNSHIYYFCGCGAASPQCCDTVYFRENGAFGFYSLADGVSSRSGSALGAAAVQKAIADWWEEEAADFFSRSLSDNKKRIIEIIHNVLYNLTKDGRDPDDFQSTLMIVFISLRHGLCRWLHIGDGLILKETTEGDRNFISFEQNGINRRYTFTTTSSPLSRYLHMGEEPLPLLSRIILLTDGAVAPFYSNRTISADGEALLNGPPSDLFRFLQCHRPADDYSMLDIHYDT